MITLAHQEFPTLSIHRLCDLLGVSRSWYYEQRSQLAQNPEEIALRDQIEHIILHFPGYVWFVSQFVLFGQDMGQKEAGQDMGQFHKVVQILRRSRS